MIYVANQGSASVTAINGTTNATSTINTGATPTGVAVNPVSNKIYVANTGSGTITVIDGATATTSTVNAATNPSAVAVNPVTNQVEVANTGSGSITVITEVQAQPVPLVASISPLAGGLVSGTFTPVFNFTAASSFSPNAPPPTNLYYQLDTWQGAWIAATNGGSGAFSAETASLPQGLHILYAYATDGQRRLHHGQ